MPESKFSRLPLSTSGEQECALTGQALLQTPFLNKGSAFTKEEREAFGLNGLLPSRINTLKNQVERAYDQYRTHRTPLGRNIYMTSLNDQNEVVRKAVVQTV